MSRRSAKNNSVKDTSAKYAFVLPRCGEEIAGGAETLAFQLAQKLAEAGDYVEVWSTCAKDNRTWEDFFAPGETTVKGITVRRFPVDARNLEVWIPLQISISQGLALSAEDELEWMRESVNSSQLYRHIAAHADEFDRLIFAPYLFGTTFWGSLIRPDRSTLIPCLHDEHYAYTQVIGSMFRQVRHCLFNAFPEQELAERLYGRLEGGEVGMGFELPHQQSVEPYLAPGTRYLIYLGRKETGKNAHLLVDYFIQAKERGLLPDDLKLVIVGGGSFEDLGRNEAKLRQDILDIAHVSETDKQRLLAHAALLCQPSVNESFSIVIMEAWLRRVPVLVHSQCAVTRHHAITSGGGLYFADVVDFAGAVTEILKNQQLKSRMGECGFNYVTEHYSWEKVLERFATAMDSAALSNQTAQPPTDGAAQ